MAMVNALFHNSTRCADWSVTARRGLPLPHVTVEGIEVGKASDLTIGEVSVTPDLYSLLTETKIIRSVYIEG